MQLSGPQQRACDSHEQRRGHSFPIDVAQHEAKTLWIEQEKIEQVAAHFLGRDHGGVQLDFGRGPETAETGSAASSAGSSRPVRAPAPATI